MLLFSDTGNIHEIESLLNINFIDGITTNPSLLAKENTDPTEILHHLVEITGKPISIELMSSEPDAIIEEAKKLIKIGSNIVIKLPVTENGLYAAYRLNTEENIKTNLTLCFSLTQALMAAKMGATYVSPFIGRLEDSGQDGIALIYQMRKMYDHYNFKTQILAASIRSVEHINQVSMAGADIATVPPNIIHKMIEHPLTEQGLKRFYHDWGQRNFLL